MHDERVAVDARVDVRVVVHDVAERADDERQVREREALFGSSTRAWCARRARSTRSKSTRTDVYTCALVAFDRTMCSAVRRRMLSNGTTSSPRRARDRCAAGAGAAARAARQARARRPARVRRGRAAGARARGAGAAARRPRATSLRVMRPPSPVPRICAGSRPCSAIMRRTSGDVTTPPPPFGAARRGLRRGAAAGRAARRRGRRRRRRGGGGCGRRRGGGGAARRPRARVRLPARARRSRGGAAGGAARAAPSAITASRTPTSTVSPSGTRISVTTPGGGRGHLGVDLVGRHLEQRLVGRDRLADLLEPAS